MFSRGSVGCLLVRVVRQRLVFFFLLGLWAVQPQAQVFRGYTTDIARQTNTDDKKRTTIRGQYESGALRFVAKYKRGKLDGEVKEYYESGVLKAEVRYKDGSRDGIAKYYHPNGVLMTKIFYRHDREAGVSRFYDENGVLTSVINYRRGTRRDADKLQSRDTLGAADSTGKGPAPPHD